MEKRKCDLCSAEVYGFNELVVAELLEEHMVTRHPAFTKPVSDELRLWLANYNFAGHTAHFALLQL